MAVLANSDRVEAWALYMREQLGAVAVTKQDLRAAVDALDDFMDTNAGAINAAIPQPARGGLTISQKAILLMYVVKQRYLKGA